MADGQHFATLDNGLRVSLVERPRGKKFSAALAVRVGSHDDPPGALGAAHLAEHLAFLRNNRSIAAELSEQHAWVNGWTCPEYTMFQFSGHVDHSTRALDLMAGILTERNLDPTEYERERSVLVAEMVDAEAASPDRRNLAIARYRRRVANDPHWRVSHQKRIKAASKLDLADVDAFRRGRYQPRNAVLAVAGPTRWGDLVESLHRRFEAVGFSVDDEPLTANHRNPVALAKYEVSYDLMRTVWLQIDFRTDATDPTTRAAAGALAYRIGGGPHSEMWRRFRDNSGEAYNAYAGQNLDLTSTQIGAYLSTDKRNWLGALRYLLERWDALARDGVDAEQLETMKRCGEQWWDLRHEEPDALAAYLAVEMLRQEAGEPVDLREKRDRALALSLGDLNAAVRSLLQPTNRSLFVGGCVARWAGLKIRRALKECERL